MEYILDGIQMKQVDEFAINTAGIPSMVLMERAALEVTNVILNDIKKNGKLSAKVLCVCGTGNNGADGLAVARQLSCAGIKVTVLDLGMDSQEISRNKGTDEYRKQKEILNYFNVEIRNCVQMSEYDYIVDGIFGIGLSREITGKYEEIIADINRNADECEHIKVIAVDIPSGINSTSGKVEGVAVNADITVTFGYKKIGMVLSPGKGYCGEILVADIGFAKKQFPAIYTYTIDDLKCIPVRKEDVNKGNCGKVLIIAGSKDMAGAACMSAMAAYRSGCGMVKVFTHENNRNILMGNLPEVLCSTYTESDSEIVLNNELEKSIAWSNTVVLGPGLSVTHTAKNIVKYTLENLLKMNDNSVGAIIIDADALNIIKQDKMLEDKVRKLAISGIKVVVTPHMGEAAKVLGVTVREVKENQIECAKQISRRLNCVCVLKDDATVVLHNTNGCDDGWQIYINTSGNAGMATAGSGDVLTGVLAGMISAGFDDFFKAVTMGVYVHGVAGDLAGNAFSQIGMKAMDEVNMLPEVFKIIGR